MPSDDQGQGDFNWVNGLIALAAGGIGTALFMLFNQNKGNPPNVGPFMDSGNSQQQQPPPPGPKKSGCGCSGA